MYTLFAFPYVLMDYDRNDPDFHEGKSTDLKYNMTVAVDHPITLSNNSRYHSHTSNTCLKDSTNSKVYSLLHRHLVESQSTQHLEQHQVERQRA